MINNKNVQNVIEKLLTQEAVFQDGHWSSAHNFESAIKSPAFAGRKLPNVPIYQTVDVYGC